MKNQKLSRMGRFGLNALVRLEIPSSGLQIFNTPLDYFSWIFLGTYRAEIAVYCLEGPREVIWRTMVVARPRFQLVEWCILWPRQSLTSKGGDLSEFKPWKKNQGNVRFTICSIGDSATLIMKSSGISIQVPKEATARTIWRSDRNLEMIVLYRNVFPVPLGP
ncbi:hypothetical protein Tco_0528011 [Tanacetum coccineum]